MTQLSLIPVFDCLRQSEMDAIRQTRILHADTGTPNPPKPARKPRRQPVNVADSTPF